VTFRIEYSSLMHAGVGGDLPKNPTRDSIHRLLEYAIRFEAILLVSSALKNAIKHLLRLFVALNVEKAVL
jgi:hypothetical protein